MLYMEMKNIKFNWNYEEDLLLNNINAHISKGDRIALIGVNGSGKSTLLRIIMGTLTNFSGEIFKKEKFKFGFMAQEIKFHKDEITEEVIFKIRGKLGDIRNRYLKFCRGESENYNIIEEYEKYGGYETEIKIRKLFNQFNLSEKLLHMKFINLSGGEKTKVSICMMLLDNPDILIMDEPTNHLDLETMDWLIDFLQKTSMPFIVVSHDRYFIDRSCNKIWNIERGELSLFTGNYSKYKKFKEEEYEKIKNDRRLKLKKINNLRTALNKRKGEAERRETFKAKRSVKKNGGICKRDMGSVKENRDEQAMMRSAMAVKKRINRILEKNMKELPFVEKTYKMKVEGSELRAKWLLSIKELSKRFGEKEIFSNFSLDIPANSRIAIMGKNGSGKSTLLKILLGLEEKSGGEFKWTSSALIKYYAQDFINLDPRKTIIEEIAPEDGEEENYVRKLLGRLRIRKEKVFEKIENLSLGEKAKISLVKLFFGESNTLILDEPTNHLEIISREAIEEALLQYRGTIIFVSHDRYFVEKIATHKITLS